MFKLTVDASPSLLPIKLNPLVRLDGRPFKNGVFPCVIGPRWQCQSESRAHIYGSGGKEPTRGLFADDRSQVVLWSKCNDHFSGARGMAFKRRLTLP
jgi:hypothetical protein